jgi:amino acid transporter
MSGTTYQAVIDAAKAGNWPVGVYDVGVSVSGGITYVALNTLGTTYVANAMGEMKEVKKSSILAMIGALLLFLLFWEIFYSTAYWGFSGDFWAAAAYFAPGGAGFGTSDVWPFGSVMPMPNLMLVYLNSNPWYAIVSSLGFGICTYAACMGLLFGPVRNLFAYAFDRVIPTYFSRTDRRGSPWAAVILGVIVSEIFFVMLLFPGFIAYWIQNATILGWFWAWIIVGVFGMAFPFTKRGKGIIDKSPEIVKKRILGLPIIFVWGLLTFIISVAIDYYMLIPYLAGLSNNFYIYLDAIFFGIAAFVVYYASRAYHKMKGVPMELQFKEIPPD